MSISELDEYLELNTHVKQLVAFATPMIYNTDIARKLPGDFKDILKRIKKTSPGSRMNTFG